MYLSLGSDCTVDIPENLPDDLSVYNDKYMKFDYISAIDKYLCVF